MPSQRPRAQFQPISPHLNLHRLVEAYDHFDFCTRIPFEAIQDFGVDSFEKLVKKHVITEGKPLVIEGFERILDRWTFSSKWLKDNVGDKVENARDIVKQEQVPLTIRHYLNGINAVTNQHFRSKEALKERPPQRIYLKDIDCPDVWRQKLAELLPPFVFYLNESTGEYGGPGAGVISNPTATGRRLGRGIAPAGDLMSSLPPEMRAENLMCYIGHEGTYTPSHREMCATMGHNIMVEASSDFDEDGKPERPGSSIWFMTEAKDRHTVAEFWLARLGHDIEVEDHFAQVNSWKLAPFKVYIVEQKPGDFILIPPLAPHQVWNRGTRTMKVAWNRSTVETLEMAIAEALPKARIVCRDEQYKNKAMIYFTLSKYSDLLLNAKSQAEKLPTDAGRDLLYKGKVRALWKDFRRLFSLYKDILLSEMFSTDGTGERCEFLPFESNVTCAYCRGNIFNRFLSCGGCADALGLPEPEPYDVCMECYAMGRSCQCISGHHWVEQFKWKELTGKYEFWRKQIIDLVGDVDRSTPLALLEERRRLPRKTLAEVVREQLKKRPHKDPNNPKEDGEETESDGEVIVDDEGRVKKIIKKRSKTWLKNHATCHVCKYRHESWKMVKCTRCDKWWCYGSLFRGHDDMPLDVMQDPDWECAHCQGVCFAGSCRLDPRQTPYQPKGTLLGHDTKKVADARSVEVLVDFSVSNLNWIREEAGAEESAQMRRAREEGERAQELAVENDDLEDEPADHAINTPSGHPTLTAENAEDVRYIDPQLMSENEMAQHLTQFNETIPTSVANMRRKNDNIPIGYTPADTTGYPDPTNDDSYVYADLNDYDPLYDLEAEDPMFSDPNGTEQGKKRKRASDSDAVISMEKPKKRRATDQVSSLLSSQPPGSQANRQFQSIKERKALEQAKRQGRFFSVSAALRGKKKVVCLKVPAARLAAIVRTTRPQADDSSLASPLATTAPDSTDMLRSDVQPVANMVGRPKASKAGASPQKARKTKPAAHRKSHSDSDASEPDMDQDEDDYVAARDSSKTHTGPRRISAYLEARHKDQDLPDELPDDFRDGRKRPRQSNGASSDRVADRERHKSGKWKSASKASHFSSGFTSINEQSAAAVVAEQGTQSSSQKTNRQQTDHTTPHIASKEVFSAHVAQKHDPPRPRGRPKKHPYKPMPSPPPKVSSTTATAGSDSIVEAEKNRLAKLSALRGLDADGADDQQDDDIDLDASIREIAASALGRAPSDKSSQRVKFAEPITISQVKAPIAAIGGNMKSIFDRKKGPGGRPIKIVSAKKMKSR